MAWNAETAPKGVPFQKGGDARISNGRPMTAAGVKKRIRHEVIPELGKAIPSLVLGIKAGEPQALIAGLQLAIFALED